MNINDIIETANKLDKELRSLERNIFANPINRKSLEKLNLDSRFYTVIYTDMVEPNKIYIVKKLNYL